MNPLKKQIRKQLTLLMKEYDSECDLYKQGDKEYTFLLGKYAALEQFKDHLKRIKN